MFKKESKYLFKLLSVFVAATALAAVDVHPTPAVTPTLEFLIKKELSKQFPNAEIQLDALSQRAVKELGESMDAASAVPEIVSLNARGEAKIHIETANEAKEISIKYSAWVEGLEAQRRILPKEPILKSDFLPKRIDVAFGYYSEFKNWIVTAKGFEPTKVEAKQTILPKNFLLTTEIEKIPDIKRGDTVRVAILMGDLKISTYGIAQEPGFLNEKIRILTQTNKKELVGQILDTDSVEVHL